MVKMFKDEYDKIRAAKKHLNSEIKRIYPIGVGIHWMHNGYLQQGKVLRHTNFDRIFVINLVTRCERFINADAVT